MDSRAGSVVTDKSANVTNPDYMDPDNLQNAWEDSLKETNATELMLNNQKLQRQIKQLQESQKAIHGNPHDERQEMGLKQLEDINKIMFERDFLQSRILEQDDELREQQRLNSEMKAILTTYASENIDPIKQQNAQTQLQTIQLQEQLREIQLKLKKAKDLIKEQDQMLKECNYGGSGGHFDEFVTSLKAEVSLRDKENEKLRKQMHEIRLQYRREQQLITSAWYDMAKKLNQ